MRISVLQQGSRAAYNFTREAPDLAELKRRASETLDECFELLEGAANEGADIAVTIEAVNCSLHFADLRFPFSEVYGGLDGVDVKRFSAAAKKHRIYVVAGLYLTIDGRTYNTAVMFDRNGDIVGIHKKVHLPAGEEKQVTPGNSYEVFDTDIGKIGMLVCWDMQFPESARILSLRGADLIVCPTLGWENIYGLCRAYENGVTIAAAMGMGSDGIYSVCDPSCIVDNMGRILASGSRKDAGVISADVDIESEPAPQYGSQRFYPSHSMRKTRFSQRRPDTYKILSEDADRLPLYDRYFKDSSKN